MKTIKPQNKIAYHLQRWLIWVFVIAVATLVLPWAPSDDAPDK